MGQSVIASCLKCKYETEVLNGRGKARNSPFYWVVLNRKKKEVEGIDFPTNFHSIKSKDLKKITKEQILSIIKYDKNIYSFYHLDNALSPEPNFFQKFLKKVQLLKNINCHFCPKCKSYKMILKDGNIFFD